MGERKTANSLRISGLLWCHQYPTVVTMKGCSIEIPEAAQNTDGDLYSSLPAVYAWANEGEGLGVAFNYDEATTFNGALEFCTENILVNGSQPEIYTGN